MDASPFKPSTPEMLAEIIRQAEARLEAQLTAGIAADQRAMTFASLLLAAAAVLFGAALATSLGPVRIGLLILVGGGLTVSSVLAIWSAQPSDWDYVGNLPSQWIGDVAAGKSLHLALAETAAWYDEMIAGNEIVIAKAAAVMRWAVRIAVTTTGVGAAAAVTMAASAL